MKSITITAKVKLYPTSEQMIILNKTLSVIRDVLNFVSAFVFGQEGIRYLELNHALYYPVRHPPGNEADVQKVSGSVRKREYECHYETGISGFR